jgi:hypothetical protein
MLVKHRITGFPVIDDDWNLVGTISSSSKPRKSQIGNCIHKHYFLMLPSYISYLPTLGADLTYSKCLYFILWQKHFFRKCLVDLQKHLYYALKIAGTLHGHNHTFFYTVDMAKSIFFLLYIMRTEKHSFGLNFFPFAGWCCLRL